MAYFQNGFSGVTDWGGEEEQSSLFGALQRGALENVVPAAVGVAGASAGAELGSAFGLLGGPAAPVTVPLGGVIGGLIGGLGSGFLASNAQTALLRQVPDFAQSVGLDEETLQRDREQHPIASFVGGAIPSLLGGRPSLDLLKAGQVGAQARRLAMFNSAISGATEAGQEYFDTGEVDPTKFAIAALTGAAFNKEWAGSRPLMALGGAVGRGMMPAGVRTAYADYTASTQPALQAPELPADPVNLLQVNPADAAAEYLRGPTSDAQPGPLVDPQVYAAQNYLGNAPLPETFRPEPVIQRDLFPTPEPGVKAPWKPEDAMRLPIEETPPEALPERDPNTPDLFHAQPYADVTTSYGPREILRQVRQLDPDIRPDSPTLKFAFSLSEAVRSGDPEAVRTRLDDEAQAIADAHTELETAKIGSKEIDRRLAALDHRTRVLDAMTRVGDEATGMLGLAKTEEERLRPPVQPEPEPTVLTPEEINTRTQQDITGEFGQGEPARTDPQREAILRDVIENPSTSGIYDRFAKALKDAGYNNGIRPDELQRLGRVKEAKQGFRDELTLRQQAAAYVDPERFKLTAEEAPPAVVERAGQIVRGEERAIAEGRLPEPPAQLAAVSEPPPETVSEPANYKLFDSHGRPTKNADVNPAARRFETYPFMQAALENSADFKGKVAQRAFMEGAQEATGLRPLSTRPKTGKVIKEAYEAGLAYGDQWKKGLAKEDPLLPEVAPLPANDQQVPAEPVLDQAAPAPPETIPEGDVLPAEHQAVLDRALNLFQKNKLTQEQLNQVNGLLNNEAWTPDEVSTAVDEMAAVSKSGKAAKRFEETPVNQQEWADYWRPHKDEAVSRMRTELVKYGIDDRVAVSVVEHTLAEAATKQAGTRGAYFPKIQAILISTGQGALDMTKTFDHEVLHALRGLDLFTSQEWQRLARATRGDRAAVALSKSAAHGNLSDETRVEEVVAEAFANWQERRTMSKQPFTIDGELVGVKTDKPFVKRMFERIVNLFKAVRDAFDRKRLAGADDIFERISSGEIGRRPTSYGNTGRVIGDDTMFRPAAPVDTPEKAEAAVKQTAQDVMTNMGDATRRAVLKLTTQRQIAETWGKKLPQLHNWQDNLSRIAGLRQDYLKSSDDTALAWRGTKAEEQKITDLLIRATTEQKDVVGTNDPEFASLSQPAQDVVRQVFDTYKQQLEDFRRLGREAIDNAENLSKPEREELLKDFNKKFGGLKVYFPLARYGKYVAVATKEGDQDSRIVQHFETRADQAKGIEALKSEGYDVEERFAEDYDFAEAGGREGYIARMNELLDKQISDSEDPDALRGIKSMLNQLHMNMLPDTAALKRGLQRKNVAGASRDGVRVFVDSTRRNAQLLAQLEQGYKLRNLLTDIKEASKSDVELSQVYNQLKRHYNMLGEYAKTPVQDALANMAYVYQLAASPSAMVVHALQTPMITLPTMEAYFPSGRAASALTKAMSDTVAGWKEVAKSGNERDVGKTEDEKSLIDYLTSRNIIGRTHASLFQDLADAPGSKYAGKLMRLSSYPMHFTEKTNRLMTALAAYRLSKGGSKNVPTLSDAQFAQFLKDDPNLATMLGGTDAAAKAKFEAYRFAEKMIADTHFDFTRENAPELFNTRKLPLPTKLLFQFKTYQQGMMYSLAHNMKAAFDKSLSPDERQIARRILTGVMMSHGALTGMMGLPMAGTLAFAANVINKVFGDPDKPHDAERDFNEMLVDNFGPDAASVMARGIFYAPGVRDLLPGDITNRAGLGDMLLLSRDLDTIDRQNILAYMGSAVLGPAGTLLAQFADGAKYLRQGETERGVELLMPKIVRDVMRAARYADSGVTTAAGAQVIPADELSPLQLAAQAAGFQPQAALGAYNNRIAVSTAQQQLQERRSALLRQFVEAANSSNPSAMRDVRRAVAQYNAARQQDGALSQVITEASMYRALRERRRQNDQLRGGVSLSRNQADLRRYSVDADE